MIAKAETASGHVQVDVLDAVADMAGWLPR